MILRIFKNDQIQEVKQFHVDQIVIGRNAEVDLDLNDSQVSPIHAMIEKREDRYFVCDLGSQSGTIKNGIPILDEPIDSGDELQIGNFKLHFSIGVPRPKSRPPVTQVPLGLSELAEVTVPDYMHSTNVNVPKSSETISSQNAASIGKAKTSKVATDFEKTVLPVMKPSVQNSEGHGIKVKSTQQVYSAENRAGIETEKISNLAQKNIQKPNLESGNQITKGRAPSSKDSEFEVVEKTDFFPLVQSKKTFAPASYQMDLNRVLKPSKGTLLQISFAWHERVIETYHFPLTQNQITIGPNEKSQINLPASLIKGSYKIIESLNSAGATVNVRPDMSGDLITVSGVLSLSELEKRSKLIRRGANSQLKLDQGEVLRLSFNGGEFNIYIRFVPPTQKPALLPLVPLTIGEIASILLSVGIVGLLALYISINVPIEQEQNKQDELMRMAQVVYQKPKSMVQETHVKPPPPPPVEKPEVKQPKKVELADKTKAASSASQTEKTSEKTSPKENHVAAGKKSPGQAADLKPSANLNKPKKFTSAKSGGAVKLGAESGSNMNTPKPVDVSKLGLASALTGGGIRTRLDQAVSGAGGIIGDSSKATGSVGFKNNRAGEDFGSSMKEVGAGGKGTATEGIAGGITKGRSTGAGTYGSEGSGLGNHSGVEVSSPGTGDFGGATIDKEGVRRVIKSKHEVIARCYEKELRFKTQLSGKIVLSFVLDDQGRATHVKIKSSDIGDANVETCIVNEFQTWRFPEAPKGELANVSYPFVFTKQN